MKAIVIGTSLSGKTILVRYLREKNNTLNIEEVDESLTKANGGVYPSDVAYKHSVLIPRIIEEVLSQHDIIFFTNVSYFTPDDLRSARSNGFKIIQLSLGMGELKKRNEFRMKNEGYEDMSRWFDDMVQYQRNMKKDGLIDLELDATQQTEDIAQKLLEFTYG